MAGVGIDEFRHAIDTQPAMNHTNSGNSKSAVDHKTILHYCTDVAPACIGHASHGFTHLLS